jgi:hypothetical protein
MWKLVFVAAALAFSVSPLDAAPQEPKKNEKSELARDVERIAKEIYPPRSDLGSARKSLAAGAALKKR